MTKIYFLIFANCLLVTAIKAQELKCKIQVNSEQITRTNKQIFQTLASALSEFVNNKQWTNKTYKQQERIECGMTFIISSQESNNFQGTLQVNVVRPVFGSSYKTPIFNFRDTDISFKYTEFEPLNYNLFNFESNLISIISFYVHIILGIDADTFSKNGGEEYFKKALEIANLAQQGNYEGWFLKINQLNRFSLIDQILAPGHKEYREVLYTYHRKGFDNFSKNKKDAKKEILQAILLFDDLFKRNQNTFLFRVFFDAKADEIAEIFKEGPEVETDNLVSVLSKISANNISKWGKIK